MLNYVFSLVAFVRGIFVRGISVTVPFIHSHSLDKLLNMGLPSGIDWICKDYSWNTKCICHFYDSYCQCFEQFISVIFHVIFHISCCMFSLEDCCQALYSNCNLWPPTNIRLLKKTPTNLHILTLQPCNLQLKPND